MISKDDILKLALLSRVQISDDEALLFEKEIEPILEYVSKVKSMNLDSIDEDLLVKNVLRDDSSPRTISQDERDIILENAPRSYKDFIEVKKVLGND